MKSQEKSLKKTSKILLVPGHCTTGDVGVYSPFLQTFEQRYNRAVAKYLVQKYPLTYDIYEHSIQGYNSRQTALATVANQKDYKYVVELHFNGFNGIAQGAEVLYFNTSKNGERLAKFLVSEIAWAYGLQNRGAKAVLKGGRGYEFLRKMKAVAVIVEPFFGDEKECMNFENVEKYAEVLHKGLTS